MNPIQNFLRTLRQQSTSPVLSSGPRTPSRRQKTDEEIIQEGREEAQKELEAQQEAQAKADKAAADAAKRAQNNAKEAAWRAEQRPMYVDADGVIQPVQPDDVWEQQKQDKAAKLNAAAAEKQQKQAMAAQKAADVTHRQQMNVGTAASRAAIGNVDDQIKTATSEAELKAMEKRQAKQRADRQVKEIEDRLENDLTMTPEQRTSAEQGLAALKQQASALQIDLDGAETSVIDRKKQELAWEKERQRMQREVQQFEAGIPLMKAPEGQELSKVKAGQEAPVAGVGERPEVIAPGTPEARSKARERRYVQSVRDIETSANLDPEQKKQALAVVEARFRDPKAYEQQLVRSVTQLADAELETLVQTLDYEVPNTMAEIQTKGAIIDDLDSQHQARVARLRAARDQIIQQGANMADSVTVTLPGGQEELWPKALADSYVAAEKSHVVALQQAGYDDLMQDVEEHNLEASKAQAAQAELVRRQEAKAKVAEDEKQMAYREMSITGQSGTVAAMQALEKEVKQRKAAIESQHAEGTAERSAAMQALQADVTQRQESIRAQAGKQAEGGAKLYDMYGDLGVTDWKGEKDFVRLKQEAEKLGMTQQDALYWMDYYQQADWSKPRGGAKERKGYQRLGDDIHRGVDAIVSEATGVTPLTEAEQVRVLPDGQITVNPVFHGDAAKYAAAVKAAPASKEAKDAAMKAFPALEEAWGEQQLETLQGEAFVPALLDFEQWRESKLRSNPDFSRKTMAAQAVEFLKMSKDRPWVAKLIETGVRRLAQGTGLAIGGVLGAAGLAAGVLPRGLDQGLNLSENLSTAGAAWTATGQKFGQANRIKGNESDLGLRAIGQFVELLPQIATMIAGAGVAGGTMKGVAALSAAQTAGAQYASTYETLRKQGQTHEQAWAQSAPFAVASGLVTAALTTAGGARGIEALAVKPSLMKASLNAAWKQSYPKLAKTLGIAEGAVKEIAEELPDELFSQISEALVVNPRADISRIVGDFIASSPELMLAVGAMGAGGEILSKRQTADAGEPEKTQPAPAAKPEIQAELPSISKTGLKKAAYARLTALREKRDGQFTLGKDGTPQQVTIGARLSDAEEKTLKLLEDALEGGAEADVEALASAFGFQLKESINVTDKPETAAAAKASIAAYNDPKKSPEAVAVTKARASALLKIGQGAKLEDLSEAELNGIGYARDPQSGEMKPGHYTNDPKTGALTWQAGEAPANQRHVYSVPDAEGKPQLVINQRALDKLREVMPAVAEGIKLDEAARLAQIKAGKPGGPKTAAPKTQQPESAEVTAAWEELIAAKDMLSKATDPAEQAVLMQRIEAAKQIIKSSEISPKQAVVEATPDRGASPQVGAVAAPGAMDTTESGPPRVAGTPVGRDSAAFPAGVTPLRSASSEGQALTLPEEERAEQLAFELSRRGLDEQQAGVAARLVVQRMGVNPEGYAVQMAGTDFDDAMTAFGWVRGKGKKWVLAVPERWEAATAGGNQPVADQTNNAGSTDVPQNQTAKTAEPIKQETTAKVGYDTGKLTPLEVPELIESQVWREAKIKAIDGFVRGFAKGKAQAANAAVKSLQALERLVDQKFGKLFDQIVIGEAQDGGGLGTMIGRDGQTVLVISPAAFIRFGAQTDGGMELALSEEVIHAFAQSKLSRAEIVGKVRQMEQHAPEMIRVWWQTYYAPAIQDGNMPANPPAKLSDDEAYHAGHEILRMMVQDAVFAGKVFESLTPGADSVTTETVEAMQGIVEWLKQALKTMGQTLKQALGKLEPTERARMESVIADIADLYQRATESGQKISDLLYWQQQAARATERARMEADKAAMETSLAPYAAEALKGKKATESNAEEEDELADAADAYLDSEQKEPKMKKAVGGTVAQSALVKRLNEIPDPDGAGNNIIVAIVRNGRITRPSKVYLARQREEGGNTSFAEWDWMEWTPIPFPFSNLVFKAGNGSTLNRTIQDLHERGYFPGIEAGDVTGDMVAAKILDVIERYNAKKTGNDEASQEQRYWEGLEEQALRFERATESGPVDVHAASLQVGDVMMLKGPDGQPHRVEVINLDIQPATEEELADQLPNVWRDDDGSPVKLANVTLKDGTTFGVQTISGDERIYVDALTVKPGQEGQGLFDDESMAMLGDKGTKGLFEQGLGARAMRGDGTDPSGFYSRLSQVIEQKMPNRADAQTIKSIISNPQTGIKAEELKWSGILTWLEGQSGPITKQAVLDYLAADGAVRLEEVRKGNIASNRAKLSAFRRRMEAGEGLQGDEQREYDRLATFDDNGGDDTKFGKYQLPGGENYREVVLAMPRPQRYWMDDSPVTAEQEANEFDRQAADRVAHYKDQPYTSSHFPDVPNYVAHMRVNDRVDAEGRPGTFLEEIQSDRHQAGRKKGYQFTDEEREREWQRIVAIPAENRSAADVILLDRLKEELRTGGNNTRTGIPDAPFRKDWALQMFKRGLRDAVATGKQWIGWTTGETQAERYDLSKQVSEIRYRKSDQTLQAWKKDVDPEEYQEAEMEQAVPMDKLADFIGKDAAQKIAEAEPGKGGWVSLKGQDLKVGGEGMKGFYDSILPKEIGKYVKQWGAGVVKSSIEEATDTKVRQRADDQWAVVSLMGQQLSVHETEEQAIEAKKLLHPIWRVDITPAMRAGVEGGQVLFSRSMRGQGSLFGGDDLSMFGAGPLFPGTTQGGKAELFQRPSDRETIRQGDNQTRRQSDKESQKPDFNFESATPEQLRAEATRREQAEKMKDRQARPLVGTQGDIGQMDMLGGGDLFASPAPRVDTPRQDAPATPRTLESDRPRIATADGGRETGVSADAGLFGDDAGSLGADGEGSQDAEGNDRATDGGAAPAGRAGRAEPVQGEASRVSGSPAGSAEPGGSGGIDEPRAAVESGAELDLFGAAPKRPAADEVAEERERTPSKRLVEQATVQNTAAGWDDIVPGDRENIARTLPILLPQQHDDVRKAEDRWFNQQPTKDDPKKGMLFTNGTGTGKTFTGLGIIKRFEMMGRGRALIVVPNQAKVADWQTEGLRAMVKATPLNNTTDVGSGVVVTTYANFRANAALQAEPWDLIVYDESHFLGGNAQGNQTENMGAHYRATNKPGFYANDKATYAVIGPRPNSENKEAVYAYEELRREKADEIKAKLASFPDTKAVFLSATPFNYHKSLGYADGYLFASPRSDSTAYNEPQGMDRYLVENFGYSMKTNRLTSPPPEVDVGLMEREWSERMFQAGAMSGRMIDVPYDYSREFILLDSKLGQQLDDGFRDLVWGPIGESREQSTYWEPLRRAFRNYWYGTSGGYAKRMQLLESIKVAGALERMNQHLDMGRKIVLFHSYNNADPVHPFTLNYLPLPTAEAAKLAREWRDLHPDLVGMDFKRLFNPRALVADEFGDRARFFNGEVSPKERMAGVKAFNADDSGVDIIMIQMEAGKEGISLHDITGKGRQRVLMNAALPVKPTDAIQSEGRIYRIGVLSNAIQEYLTLHTAIERSAFGSKISERTGTVENMALGKMARTLKDSFKSGYLNAHSEEPSAEQGLGGKKQDTAELLGSDMDRAKSYYFGRQKKTSKTKAAEGIDYFATPEPVGLTMVRFLNAKAGMDLLEPSAGHGAIGRFFPEFTTNKYVEPSRGLSDELRIKVAAGKVEVMPFEDLHIVNKFDGVAMNPPFGTAGKMAMEHVTKAAKHLRQGGRLVALIPEGAAMNKRFEQWLYEGEGKDMHLRASYGLPTVTFERAGTSVKTRIVVLDKADLWEIRKEGDYAWTAYDSFGTKRIARQGDEASVRAMAKRSPDFIGFQGEIDLQGRSPRELSAETIGELFDQLENLSPPGRIVRDVATDVVSEDKETGRQEDRETGNNIPTKREYSPVVTKANDSGFTKALKEKMDLDAAAKAASDALQAFPRGEMGLTPDAVKAMPEWRAAKAAYDTAAAKLKTFNQSFLKQWDKEYRQHIQEKRAGVPASPLAAFMAGGRGAVIPKAAEIKAGQYVRVEGKGPVFQVESIGTDGWVYLKNGQGSYSSEDAAKLLMPSTADAAENERPKGGFPGMQAPAAAPSASPYSVAETLHAKKGTMTYVAKMDRRLSDTEYRSELSRAKAAGGYYSAFKGSGAIPGFQFPSAAVRDAFVAGYGAGQMLGSRAMRGNAATNEVQSVSIRGIFESLYGKEKLPRLASNDARSVARLAARDLRREMGAPSRAAETLNPSDIRIQAAILANWARDNGLLITQLPVDYQPGSDRDFGQMEHSVWRTSDKQRVVKLTKPGQYGLYPVAQNIGWDMRAAASSPLRYLERLEMANQVFGDDWVLHGVLVNRQGQVQLLTSQPAYDGELPGSIVDDTPDEEQDVERERQQRAITKEMADHGFAPSRVNPSTFYRASDNTAVFDAHLYNVMWVNTPEGRGLVPFDVIVMQPQGKLRENLQQQMLGARSMRGQGSLFGDDDLSMFGAGPLFQGTTMGGKAELYQRPSDKETIRSSDKESQKPDFNLESASPEQLRAETARREQAEKIKDRQSAPLIGTQGDIGQMDMLGGGDMFAQPANRLREEPFALDNGAMQQYFDLPDVRIPTRKQPTAKRFIEDAGAVRGDDYPISDSAGSVRQRQRIEEQRERAQRDWRGLIGKDVEALKETFRTKDRFSTLLHDFVTHDLPHFDIRGAIIKGPEDFAAFNLAVRTPYFESLKIAILDSAKQVVHSQIVHVGALNESLADPKAIARVINAARQQNPRAKLAGWMVAHNHPSGDPSPSDADQRMTRRFASLAEVVGLPLLDHVVTNGERYFSFAESGMIGSQQIDASIDQRSGRPSTPKLPVKPTPDGPGFGYMSDWEAVAAGSASLPKINSPQASVPYFLALKTADPDHHHVLYLDTRLALRGVERFPLTLTTEQLFLNIMNGCSREGALAFALGLPTDSNMVNEVGSRPAPTDDQRRLIRRLKDKTSVVGLQFVDAMTVSNAGFFSFQEFGLMEEGAKYETVDAWLKTRGSAVDSAAHEAATSPENDLPEPTQAQKEAGNYKLGHVRISGHDISIENPAGSQRKGTDPSGKAWSVTMKDHYGYFKGTNAKDGDAVDVFVKAGTPADYSGPVHVVRQVKPGTRQFDEYKVMLGYPTAEEARAAYLRNYAKGWQGLDKLTSHTQAEFQVIKDQVFTVPGPVREGDKVLASRAMRSDDTATDAEYLAAVDAGDMAKAQRMVDARLEDIGAFWHGTPSGDLRGGRTGLHVGTKQAAMEALEARIGIPADGKGWDGTREYGKTLLAGKTKINSGIFGKYRLSGYNVDAPNEDYYPSKMPTVGNGIPVDPTWKPWLRPVLIVGEMTNTKHTPISDNAANRRIKRLRGAFYTNTGEDYGSVSAVLPDGSSVKVKVAEPVTRDESGQVIPLSQRFNPESDSILYSRAMRGTDPETTADSLDKVGEVIAKTGTAMFVTLPVWTATTAAKVGSAAVEKTGVQKPLAWLGSNRLDKWVYENWTNKWLWARARNGKDAVKAWLQKPGALNGVGKAIADNALPLWSVPREWLAMMHESQRKAAWGREKAMDVVRALSHSAKVSDLAYPKEFVENPAYRVQMFDAMEGKVPMTSLPKPLQELAARLRGMLETTGRELVKQGLMSLDTFEELRDTGWMPRFTEDEAAESAGSWLKAFKLGIKDLKQQRSTAWHIVDTTKKDATGQYVTVNRAEGAKRNRWRFRDQAQRDAFYEDFIRREAVDFLQSGGKDVTNMLAALNIPDQKSIRDQIAGLTRASIDMPAAMSEPLRNITRRAVELQRVRYKKEKPFEPDKLIKDPVYAVARYVMAQTHNAATMELMKETAKVASWVTTVDTAGFTEIPDNPRFGPLAGKFVRDDIATQVLDVVNVDGAAMKFYDALLRKWKGGKLVLNPGSHIRDAVGNTAFAYLGGNSLWNPGNWPYYRDAIAILRDGGPKFAELIEMQVLGGDAYTTQVKTALRGLLPDQKTVENADAGALMRMVMGLGAGARGTYEYLSALRSLPDDFYKTAAFNKYRAQGMDPREAAAEVRKWFPYYDRLGTSAYWKVSGRFLNPFGSFFRESTRILGRAAMERPMALSATLLFASAVTRYSLMALGLGDDDEEAVFRAMRGKLKGGVMDAPVFSMLLPMRTGEGQLQQWDLSSVMPFADLIGTRVESREGEDEFTKFWRGLFTASPVLAAAWSASTNTDAFTGRKIVQDDMGVLESTGERLKNIAGDILPPLTPFVGVHAATLSNAGRRTGSLDMRNKYQSWIRAIVGMDVRSADPDLRKETAFFRKQNNLPVEGNSNTYTTPLKSRLAADIRGEIIQDNPSIDKIAEAMARLEASGNPVKTPKQMTDLLDSLDPTKLIKKEFRSRLIASFSPEAKRVFNTRQTEFKKSQAKAPGILAEIRRQQAKGNQ